MMGHDGRDGARISGFSEVCWPFRVPGTPESTREGMEEETRPVLSSTAALATPFVPGFRFCDSGFSTFLEPQKLIPTASLWTQDPKNRIHRKILPRMVSFSSQKDGFFDFHPKCTGPFFKTSVGKENSIFPQQEQQLYPISFPTLV